MKKKPKFDPVVTRVKLNPEQAVLTCGCYQGSALRTAGTRFTGTVCQTGTKTTYTSYSASSKNASIS